MSTTHHDFVIKHGLSLADDTKIKIGNSDDLQLYHDSNNSFITDSGTGGLYIRGSNFVSIQNAAGSETMIYAAADGAVQLKYDNSTRLQTTSTGIEISGTHGNLTHFAALNTSGFHVYTDRPQFYFNKPLNIITNDITSYDGDFLLKRTGSTRLTLTTAGATVTGALTATTNLIATTATYSPIVYGGGSSLQLKSNTGEMFAEFNNNGNAELY